MECQYEEVRRATYDCGEVGQAVFVPTCVKCHRFVKADITVLVNEVMGLSREPNATCARCGRTHMHFEGFF